MAKKEPKGNYEIGYGRPPKHSQWQPNQTGNPKGRPKGSKNVKTDLEAELKEQLEIKEGNTVKRITKQRALIKSQVNKAIKGDVRAAATIINLQLKFEELSANARAAGVPLDSDEQEILDILKKRLLRRAAIEPQPPDKANGGGKVDPAQHDDHHKEDSEE